MTARFRGALGAVQGLRAFTGGFGFVLTTPTVWPYALVPVAMMAVLTCGLGLLGAWGAMHLSDQWFHETTTWAGRIGSWLTTAALGVSALLIAVLLALGLAQPLSGFALEAIVREQERVLTGRTTPAAPFGAALRNSLKITGVTLAVGGSVLPMLFLVSLVFPPAAVVTVPLKILVGGWLLAWDFLDYPLGMRGLGVRARWRWVRRNLEAFTLFGVAWTLLMVVPGAVLLLLPMGVAGAARLMIEDDQRG